MSMMNLCVFNAEHEIDLRHAPCCGEEHNAWDALKGGTRRKSKAGVTRAEVQRITRLSGYAFSRSILRGPTIKVFSTPITPFPG